MLLEFQTVFPGLINIMDSVYRGGRMVEGCMGWVVVVGGEPCKGRFFHTIEQKGSHCVFTEVNRQPQFTC